MIVGRDPAAPGRYVLAQVRNSNAPLQPSLDTRSPAARAPAGTDLAGHKPAHVGRAGRDEEAQAARSGGHVPGAVFGGGPRTTKDIWEAAQKAGISDRTLQRARSGLEVRNQRVYEGGQQVNYWLLPGQNCPRGSTGDPVLDDMFAELERQFPPRRTPLDEKEEDE